MTRKQHVHRHPTVPASKQAKRQYAGLLNKHLTEQSITWVDLKWWEQELVTEWRKAPVGFYDSDEQYDMDYYGDYRKPPYATQKAGYQGYQKVVAEDRKNDGLPKPGIIRVVNDDGSVVGSFTIGDDFAWWYRNARFAWRDHNVHTIGDDEIVDIPAKFAKITKVAPSFSSCTFDSTKDYLEAIWGRKLDASDKAWMGRHPKAEEMGVPQEYSPIAIAELVEPYNLRISRIRVSTNAFFTGEALDQWVLALGCNPFAVGDHATTNEVAAERLGITLADAAELWRFDFGDHPLAPSILGERQLATPQASLGKRGGHARYLAPRAGHGEWFISIQLAPKGEVSYVSDPVFPPYIPREDTITLMMFNTKGPNNVDLDSPSWYHQWKSLGFQPEVVVSPPPSLPSGQADGGEASIVSDPNEQAYMIEQVGRAHILDNQMSDQQCAECQEWLPEDLMLDGVKALCFGCYIDLWDGYVCGNKRCQLHYSKESGHIPLIIGVDATKDRDVLYGCPNPKCNEQFTLSDDDEQFSVDAYIWCQLNDEFTLPTEMIHASLSDPIEGPIS